MSGGAVDFSRQCISIIGLGLIGGSIARGLRAAGHAAPISGCVVDAEDAKRAGALGIVDEVSADMKAAVANAGLIVVAVPIGAMAGVFETLAEVAPEGAVITDVGSVKLGVLASARAFFGERMARFVPGHPIAGTEHGGLEAGFATLFQGRRVILTPTPQTDPDALARVETLWQSLGASVSQMNAAHHDEVLAATSHLPHLLAFGLVDTLARMAERTEIFEYAAGGFADFTRIASSDPALWRDIVTANRDAVLPVLDRYIGDLGAIRQAVATGDGHMLVETFGRAKQARDRFAAVHSHGGS